MPITPRQFIEKMIDTFGGEFIYYTHPDVQATAHQVGTPFKDSWTTLLCEMGVIQRPASTERYTELERTLSSLYCFELNMQEVSTVQCQGQFVRFEPFSLSSKLANCAKK